MKQFKTRNGKAMKKINETESSVSEMINKSHNPLGKPSEMAQVTQQE